MCTTWYWTAPVPGVTRMWSSTCETPLNTYVYRSSSGSVEIRSVRMDGPLPSAVPVRSAVIEGLNWKSFRSPSTTTSAFLSTARICCTKSWTTCAWPARCTADDCAGNWNRPSAPWSPPFESKWLPTTNTVWPWNRNSPTSGLRLVVHTGLVGSIRPGESVRSGLPCDFTTAVPVVERSTVDGPRSTNETRAALKRNTTRMLPPGCPPSLSLTGSISRHSYCGPPAANIACVSLVSVWSAATTPLSVAPVLSWISSTAMTSGFFRLSTTPAARRWYLVSPSPGARFSTLYVATASWSLDCGVASSGGRSWCATLNCVAAMTYPPKL